MTAQFGFHMHQKKNNNLKPVTMESQLGNEEIHAKK